VPTSTLTPATFGLLSSTGTRKIEKAAVDTAASRGAAFEHLLHQAQPGDTLVCGPGEYTCNPYLKAAPNITIWFPPGRSIIRGNIKGAGGPGDGPLRFICSSGQRFHNLRSDRGNCLTVANFGPGHTPDVDVTDLWFVDCEIEGGEDLLFMTENGTGAIQRQMHIIRGQYKTSNAQGIAEGAVIPSANDVVFAPASHVSWHIENVRFEATGTITGSLDMVLTEIAGVKCSAEIRNCDYYLHATGELGPNDILKAACIRANNGTLIQLRNTHFRIANPASIPNYYLIRSDGAGTRVQIAKSCSYDIIGSFATLEQLLSGVGSGVIQQMPGGEFIIP
jgi:hypothetical protein